MPAELDPPTVASAEWATISVPVYPPLRSGQLLIAGREYCCLRVRDHEGVAGEAYVMTRGLPVSACLEPLIRPALATPAAPLDGPSMLVRTRNLGWSGPISRAASLLGIALLDLDARRGSRPVWSLAGHDRPPEPPAVVAIGYSTGPPDLDSDLEQAHAAVAGGAVAVKLMGGFDPPENDLARVRSLRRTLPDDVAVGLDVNGAWTPDMTARLLPLFTDAGGSILEDPYPYEATAPPELPPGQRAFLALGEVVASPLEVRGVLDLHGPGFWRPDVTLLGGPDLFAATVSDAHARSIRVMPHFWPEYHRHLLPPPATCDTPDVIEWTLPGAGGFARERFVTGLPHLGEVPTTAPGFGIEIDWTAVGAMATGPVQRLPTAES